MSQSDLRSSGSTRSNRNTDFVVLRRPKFYISVIRKGINGWKNISENWRDKKNPSVKIYVQTHSLHSTVPPILSIKNHINNPTRRHRAPQRVYWKLYRRQQNDHPHFQPYSLYWYLHMQTPRSLIKLNLRFFQSPIYLSVPRTHSIDICEVGAFPLHYFPASDVHPLWKGFFMP